MLREKWWSPSLAFLTLVLAALACNYPDLRARQRAIPDVDQYATQVPKSTTISSTTQFPRVDFPTMTTEDGMGGGGLGVEDTRTTPPATEIPASTPTEFTPSGYTRYTIQPGDTLSALANRFGVKAGMIIASQSLPIEGYLPHGLSLSIPFSRTDYTPATHLLPDSELVFSPSAAGFDVYGYTQLAGGFLRSYTETLDGETLSGIQIVERVATESSINPRLLLALLEFQGGWVMGATPSREARLYPLGFRVPDRLGLYQELLMTATHLNIGYYGWRSGRLLEIKHTDLTIQQLHPTLNAGSAALQYLFALLYHPPGWWRVLYESNNFLDTYDAMFGDAWQRATQIGPLLPDGLLQPPLELPFLADQHWSLTAGPHPAWKTGSPPGALDLAPVTGEPPCSISRVWATALAPGQVVRAGHNTVALDLDGDGFEGSGWVLVYYHLAEAEMVQSGTSVGLDFPLGHPSCEGGRATGTHLHIARKYNGEWLAADGPLPFVMSGWRAVEGEKDYLGGMVNGSQTVYASPIGRQTSIVVRTR